LVAVGVNKFKSARLEKGLRQLDVARAAGVGEGYISRIETGRVTPSRELLQRLAAVLDVPSDYLATESDHAQ
jgi:transcriptional regulator with XRE-family HTH domain